MFQLSKGIKYIIVYNGFKKYVLKSINIPIFSVIFLNLDSSFDMKDRTLKLSVVVLGIIMEGTVSQIFLFRP